MISPSFAGQYVLMHVRSAKKTPSHLRARIRHVAI
jgi:hypothetical protein